MDSLPWVEIMELPAPFRVQLLSVHAQGKDHHVRPMCGDEESSQSLHLTLLLLSSPWQPNLGTFCESKATAVT